MTETADLDREITEYLNEPELQALTVEYAPYHDTPEFVLGFADHVIGYLPKKYEGVAAQSYDRGAECAMRAERKGLITGHVIDTFYSWLHS